MYKNDLKVVNVRAMDIVFLDFSGTFDSVPYEVLVLKKKKQKPLLKCGLAEKTERSKIV